MRRTTTYVVFAVIYGALLLLACFAADQFNSKALGSALTWTAPFAVAPFALLGAMRFGHFSYRGVAVTSITLGVCTCVTTVGILIAIAVPVVGGPTFEYIASMFTSYLTIGGWRLLLSFGVFVAAPLLWAVPFLSRRPRTSRAAA